MANKNGDSPWANPRAHSPKRALSGHDYSPESRAIVARSRTEAEQLGDDRVDTEHLLLAIAQEPTGTTSYLLAELHLDREAVLDARRRVAAAPTETAPLAFKSTVSRSRIQTIPFSRSAKLALEFAAGKAADLGQSQIQPEHLALGAIATGDSATAKILRSRGISLERAEAVLRQHTGALQQQSLRLQIDDSSDHSIFEQIVAQIQERIATSQLHPGDRLPAIRQMADDLDVAPGTVARAYAELERAGVVVTDGPRGTRVAPGPIPTDLAERLATLSSLLRPAIVAAFHLGATAAEVRASLDAAMRDILPDSS